MAPCARSTWSPPSHSRSRKARSSQWTCSRAVRWSDVLRIRTYKIDLVDIDCVCVRFDLRDGATVEVTEESNGFNDFMDELAAQFPSIDADWYATVMTPAFARNEAVLFERAPG